MNDEVDQIMAVMNTAFDPKYGEAWTRSQVENALLMGNCHSILVDADGHLPEDGAPAAGFSLIRSVLDEDELLLFAVDPRHRRRGLGSAMLELMFQNCRDRGVKIIHLEMRRDNPAEHLYRAHGFTPVGIRPNYYRTADGGRIDAISFRCAL